jgi:CHRD domain
MRRRTKALRLFGSAVLSAGVALAVLVPAAPAGAATATTLHATLSGAEEVPGPGDTDGSGIAEIKVNPKKQKVCFVLVVLDIDLPATAAHIHEGVDGVAGDVVVTLAPPVAFDTTDIGFASGCVKNLSKPLLKDIKRNPEAYYVNVHNEAFPDGAVRGQLATHA